MNEMFDIAAARKAEREAHIPGAVVEILLLYALLSAGIVGYVLGASEARHRGITFVLFVLLTLSLVLILDLDRPWRGGVTVSQQPMADLVAGLKTRS
jgi:ABC-type branched-subunit amino acid transport system permease subunit